ncbi:MAG: PilZ domain-containing protein [Bacillota bacterium]
MMKGTEIITVKQKVLLQADLQPAFPAKITEVDKEYFWVNLPKEGNQVLVLQKNQRVRVGISLPTGFYQADTFVGMLGANKDAFYALAIPREFTESQERRFVRAHHSANVLLRSSNITTQTALVNFSAGGIMVYLVPELESMLESGEKIKAKLNIEDFSFELDVRLTWRKLYDGIPFAGFEFVNLTPPVQGALALLSIRYSDNN